MCSTSEIADIFNTFDEIFLIFAEKKKVNFLFLFFFFFFFFCLRGKTYFLSYSFLDNFAWLSRFSGYNYW